MKANTDLLEQRTALCDLLIGLRFRAMAAREFYTAMLYENWPEPSDPDELSDGHSKRLCEDHLERAMHLEWVAVIAETGQVLWGGRNNRCGFQPKTEESRG